MTVPELGADAYHGLAGEIALEIATASEASPVALLADLLVSFGNCVRASPFVRVGRSQHRARLFVILVGATARAREGMSRGEIRPVFEGADPHWSADRVRVA